ncbi:hypothetical protein [Arundinibacter roseus]|uniref:Esterase n=1 Tax=Arundinibacter roseus TaxID=2070510 RepID=A0A4R4KK30_9BACT|nr:hypothetical protein [Arundinibacter roseus]TDB67019.1 hypothetical protein EZE20_07855 [Arundinibacter roseus]
MNKLLTCLLWLVVAVAAQAQSVGSFEIQFSPTTEGDLDGRMLLFLSTKEGTEPRYLIKDEVDTQQMFGMDVEGKKAGQKVAFDKLSRGYPKVKMSEIPAGEYVVQALFHRYETFKRADGHTVKLPMDRGEGQNWRSAPGNLYSVPKKIYFDPASKKSQLLTLDLVNPDLEDPASKQTKYIKYVKIKSKKLSEFWGRDMHLAAWVLIPHGFDEHPEARYPLALFHGHFPESFAGFSETPPPADMDTSAYSERFGIYGYSKIVAQEAYDFYKKWTSPDFPRYLVVEIQHANPFYDDSYAVNSANLGPYGDAIMYELLPEIERQYRGIGQGWARFTYGGSTGGWEALAAQVFYPDEFNGCFAACPDPITFEAYTMVNLYKDKNAYYWDGPFKQTPRPGKRNYLGQMLCTLQDMNNRELVLGSKGRSGDQWDIWQAVYSPVGQDGYPKPIWDKLSGEIDPSVAQYWKENYDLMHILKRDWKTLGPKLTGKIHIYCGDMDNYYLNNAVYLMEDFLKKTEAPHYYGEVAYGDRAEHCWNGDPTQPNHITRLRYNWMYLPKILERLEKSAPVGADLRSWRH